MSAFTHILTIAREEFRSINRLSSLRWLMAIILLTLVLAAFVGWDSTRSYNAEQAHYQHEVEEQWEHQPNRHPHRAAHYGYLVFRDKYPLSAFDFGVNSFVGNSVFLEAHRQNTINMSEASFSNSIVRFGEMSMALIFELIVPLFIIFMGFASISGLKQNGVLKLMLIQNCSYREIMWGKILGLYAVTMLYFLPILFLGLLFSYFTNTLDSQGIAARMVLLIIFYSAYFFIFSGIVVVFSALHRRATFTLLSLLMLWFAFVFIVPKAAQTIGARLFEAPNKNTFEAQIHERMKEQGNSHDPNDPHFLKLRQELLKKYNVKTIDELPLNYSGVQMAEGEKISAQIFGEQFEKLVYIYQKQNKVGEVLGLINPFLAIRNLSMECSGSGFSDAVNFQRQVEDYRYTRTQYLNKVQTERTKFYDNYQVEFRQKVDREIFQNMPTFHYKHLRVGQIVRDSVWGIAALVFAFIIIIIAIERINTRTNKYIA